MTDALATLDLAALPPAVRNLLLAQDAALKAERAALAVEAERADRLRQEADQLRQERAELRDQTAELKEQTAQLREQTAELKEQTAQLRDENAELSACKAHLEYLVKEYRNAIFARRSERISAEQLDLLSEDLETAIAETTEKVESRTPRGNRAPPRRNIGRLPRELARIERVIEPASTACPCGCGEMVRIGEDRSERLDIVPAQFKVIVTVRPKYACRTCEAISQALAPAHLIEGGLPTEALVAHVLVSKFGDHTPLYRQSDIFARSGLELDRSTLSGWAGKGGFHLAPVVDRLAEHLKASTHLFMDETRAPVLDPGRGRTRTGYLWALVRDERGWGGTGPPGVVFHYSDGRSGDFAADFLKGFSGVLQVDGYAGYNQLTAKDRAGGAIVLAKCWAHARRRLKEIYDTSRSPIAAKGLRRIAELYQIEAGIRGLAPEERKAARERLSTPLVAAFRTWLTEKRARVSAKSRLGEKLTYIHNQWPGLQVFLTDGRVEMDSNPVENRIRPVALGRKNFLFAGHHEGGRVWARMASLIATCKLNDIEPFSYLTRTLEAIVNGHPKSRIDELLPGPFARTSI
jgi:transposase/regulator of replication initiation timing